MKYVKEEGWSRWINKPPINVEIWGCAYSTNNTEKTMALRKKPVKGIIKEDGRFYEFKKDSKTLKESGVINYTSRYYADTKEECVEIYNSLIDKQVSFLRSLLDKCIDDYK